MRVLYTFAVVNPDFAGSIHPPAEDAMHTLGVHLSPAHDRVASYASFMDGWGTSYRFFIEKLLSGSDPGLWSILESTGVVHAPAEFKLDVELMEQLFKECREDDLAYYAVEVLAKLLMIWEGFRIATGAVGIIVLNVIGPSAGDDEFAPRSGDLLRPDGRSDLRRLQE